MFLNRWQRIGGRPERDPELQKAFLGTPLGSQDARRVLWLPPWTPPQPPWIVKALLRDVHHGLGEALEACAALRTAVWKSVKIVGFC